MKSVRYVVVRLEFEHPENVTPEEVVDESVYCFNLDPTDGAELKSSEIVACSETVPE